MTREEELSVALAESVKLQAHYAELLNMHDGGARLIFKTPAEWIARLKETGTINMTQNRFECLLEASGAYSIRDNEAKKWNMPERAVSLFLRMDAAVKIVNILNKEWATFQRNPT
jgi:hypothetical protein